MIDYATVTLTGTFLLLDRTPAVGKVTVRPSRPVIVGGEAVMTGAVSVALDAVGHFALELPASDDPILGAPFSYIVHAHMEHAVWRADRVVLPQSAMAVDLSGVLSDQITEWPTRAEWDVIVGATLTIVAADADRAEAARTGAESAQGFAEDARDAAQALVDVTVTSGDVVGDNLILTRTDGSTVDAGDVRGPKGDPGDKGDPGTPNKLAIGTVTTGAPGSSAAADITGDAPSQVLNLKIPQGATGAVSAWEYYAAGRPDVVGTLDAAALAWRNAAPSGSTFYSTDGPQGAWVWRKRGTSWVCVEGDTGWLDISSELKNGWEAANTSVPRAYIKRNSTTVSLDLRISLRADSPLVGVSRAANQNLIQVPQRFEAPRNYATIGAANVGTSPIFLGYGDWLISISGGTGVWASGDTLGRYLSYPSRDPWPLTL